MAEFILPSFAPGRFPEEGSIIGRLVVGYGELELEMTVCLQSVLGDFDAALRAIFGATGGERRIKEFKKLARGAYAIAQLGPEFSTATAAMNWCRIIRNQYAHGHWYDSTAEGVCFYALETLVKSPSKIELVTTNRHPVDIPLLGRQEEFFKYTQKCFWHLQEKYPRAAKRPSIQPVMPPAVARPPLHN
jgi:hypothetical protein